MYIFKCVCYESTFSGRSEHIYVAQHVPKGRQKVFSKKQALIHLVLRQKVCEHMDSKNHKTVGENDKGHQIQKLKIVKLFNG